MPVTKNQTVVITNPTKEGTTVISEIDINPTLLSSLTKKGIGPDIAPLKSPYSGPSHNIAQHVSSSHLKLKKKLPFNTLAAPASHKGEKRKLSFADRSGTKKQIQSRSATSTNLSSGNLIEVTILNAVPMGSSNDISAKVALQPR